MKYLYSLLSIMLIGTASVHAQQDNCTQCIDTTLRNLNATVKDVNAGELLVSWPTFNKFVAKKAAYYLSGSDDLSLYKNFATANISDGRFSFGANFATYGTHRRLMSLHTVAFKSNAKNNFSNIFSGDKLNDELSISYKYTIFINSKMFFFTSKGRSNQVSYNKGNTSFQKKAQNQKDKMNDARVMYYYKAKVKADQYKQNNPCQLDCGSAMATLKDFSPNSNVKCNDIKDVLSNEFCTGYNKEVYDGFYEYELNKLGTDGVKKNGMYNILFTQWFSLLIDLPITANKYLVATDTSMPFIERSARPMSLGFNYNLLVESRLGTVIGNLGYTYKYINTISAGDDTISKYTKADYIQYDKDNNTLISSNAKNVYVGYYSQFWSHVLSAQMIWFAPLPTTQKIGLDFILAKEFHSRDDLNNSTIKKQPLNFTAGIPLYLSDKDGKATINVEFQFRWMDINDKAYPDMDKKDKFTFGLSLGVPFGSKIY